MENDGRMGLRCVVPPEQAEHAALKEYATIRLMQVISERDAAIVERDNALAEKKSALSERDSAFLQRDIAFAERDAAIIERENAMAALGAARGHHRTLGWSQYKRQHLELIKGREAATMLQMSLPNAPFGVDEAHPYVNDASMFGFVNSFGKLHQQQQSQAQAQPQAQQQAQAQQLQLQQQQDLQTQQKPNGKPRKKETSKTKRKAADDGSKLDVKKKRDANRVEDQENVISPVVVPPPAASYHGQEIALTPPQKNEMNLGMDEMKEVEYVINTPIPHCSCTGAFQPCYRWGNGGWQSACCTTTLSMHPLPMNPLKKGYRLPGRKMSAGAFQKLVRRLAQEGADLSQPIDLKDFWAKHGTNRYVTIK